MSKNFAVNMIWFSLPFYKWQDKYGGMQSQDIKQLK